jgi:thiol:disulfide interchange protein DsbC
MKNKLTVIIYLFGIIIIFTSFKQALAFGGCEQKCNKCHSLSSKEAENILKGLIPDIKVIGVRTSPAKGLWEVSISARDKTGIAYVDFSKENVIFGDIIKIKAKKNLTMERLMEIRKIDFSKIPLDDALIMGNKEATHKVVVFDDPDCPFCMQLHKEIKKVVEKRKDIVFFIKLFPLKIHKDAYKKAKAIQCEKSLKLLEDAFAKKSIPDPKCETDIIDKNIKLASSLGITSTPTIVFEDGRIIIGTLKAIDLINLIDKK